MTPHRITTKTEFTGSLATVVVMATSQAEAEAKYELMDRDPETGYYLD